MISRVEVISLRFSASFDVPDAEMDGLVFVISSL